MTFYFYVAAILFSCMDQLYTLPKHLSCHWGGLQVLHSHHTTSAFTPFFQGPAGHSEPSCGRRANRPSGAREGRRRSLLHPHRRASPGRRHPGRGRGHRRPRPPPRPPNRPRPPWARPGGVQAVWRWRAALGCPRGRASPALLSLALVQRGAGLGAPGLPVGRDAGVLEGPRPHLQGSGGWRRGRAWGATW